MTVLTLTPEQSSQLRSNEDVIVLDQQKREFFLVPAEHRALIERLMNPEEVDESFFECEDVPGTSENR